MNEWEVLGICETEDEEMIKKAYLEKLPENHPEDNPEGFRRLRAALEKALAAVRQAEEEKEEPQNQTIRESQMMGGEEIRELLKKADELYQDFGRRIDPGEWETLLKLPVCQELESQKEAGWALIGYLMDHSHLPHRCYQVLDRVFGWTEDEDELYEHFPEDYAEYLLGRIEHEDAFRYERMEIRDGFAYDKYFSLYFALRKALNDRDRDKAEELLENIDHMQMEHPDMLLLRLRHEFMQESHESQAWKLAVRAFQIDQDNPYCKYWYIRIAMAYKDAGIEKEELEELIGSLLEQDDKNPAHWELMGTYLRGLGENARALSAYMRARNCREERWDHLEDMIRVTAEALSHQQEEDPAFDDWWQMANICMLGHRHDRARQLLESHTPGEDQEMSWLIMLADSCHGLEDYTSAVKYRQAVWDVMPEEERPLALYMDLAEEYHLAGDKGAAIEIYEKAQEQFPYEPECCYQKARLLSDTEEALAQCDRALKMGFHKDAFCLRLELLLELDRYQEVKNEAKQVLGQGLRSLQVAFDYAKALRGLEEYEEAEQTLKAMIESGGAPGVICQEYAGLCYDMDRPAEALEWIEKAIEDKDTPLRRVMKGDYLHELNRYEEEAAIYQEMLERDANDYFLLYRLGRALLSMRRYEEAEQYFRRSLEERPSYGLAWDYLGDALQDQGKWEAAAHAYEEGWKNGNRQAARDLCRLMKRTRQNEKAEEHLRKALKQYPDDTSLLWIYGAVLKRQKRYEEAVRCMIRYIEVKPSATSSAYREIASYYEAQKEYDKAEEYYQMAIDHEPENARNYRMFGKYYANSRDMQAEALPYLQRAAELEPTALYGWLKLGEVYEALGRMEEAKECYQKSLDNYIKELEKDPYDCCSMEGMADVLAHLGRFEEAEEMFKKVFSCQNTVFTCNAVECYEAMEDLAKMEERRGDLNEALKWMRKAAQYKTTDYYDKKLIRLEELLKQQS